MKILLIRHGEALDDIENRYGGWADHELTDKGRQQIKDRLVEIQKLKIGFQKVYASDLKRAYEIGKIIGETFEVPVEELQYAKEYNGYGVLSGMKKEDAEHKYPDQVSNLKNKLEVDGMESLESFERRITRVYDILVSSNLQNIILVSHGGFLKKFVKTYLNLDINKIEDCGFMLIEIQGKEIKKISSAGFE